jgi:hypothetical protein
MTDWKETKRVLDEARRVERDAVELSRRVGIPDPMVQYRADAAARAAEVEAETQRRLRETRRDQRERRESAGVVELRAEIEALRRAMNEADTQIIDAIEKAIIPMVENACDGLQRKIREIGERSDQRLREMQSEVRGAINKRDRAGEVIDMPSLREVRKVN